jgi:pimeloyl-ACP methyl ester carboxylesterase
MKNIIIASIVFAGTLFANSKNPNNYPFDVKTSGKGNPTIIFIPGFACSGQVWDETKALYEKDHTCYTLTMPGFAGTPAQTKPTFAGWEKSIVDFIKKNKIIKPIIVGHSMGGGLALAIAADYPDLVSKIVVVDALPCLDAMMDSTFKSNPNNDCTSMDSEMVALSDTQFYQMQKRNIAYLMADSTRAEKVVQWSMKSDRKTMAEMFCDFSNTDLREKISTIKCPCLILLEANFAYNKSAVEKQYKNLKTAQLEYATKGLHFVMYDDTEWYNREMTAFINKA